MHYDCPEPGDISDVRELNREFLADLLRQRHPSLRDLDRNNGEALARLAEAPFLLYELRAPDAGFWDRTFSGTSDLLDSSMGHRGDDAGQVASTLGFLWHLSKRDPHAARLFTGSSTDWCQRLSGMPLIHVINRALGAGVRPYLRMDAHDSRWRARVCAASGPDKAAHSVAVTRVLQALLVAGEGEVTAQAACRLQSPTRRFVARERG